MSRSYFHTVSSIVLVLIMILAMFSGCGNSSSVETTEEEAATETESTVAEETEAEEDVEETILEESEEAEEAEETEETEETEEEDDKEEGAVLEGEAPESMLGVVEASHEITYPLEGEAVELSFWVTFRSEILNYLEDYSDHATWIAVQEATNVTIDFKSISQDQNSTQFALMIASGDYPDLISQVSSNYTGGTTKALEEEVIISLNDYLEEYAPNYWATINASEDRLRDVKNDDGQIGEFVAFKLDVNVSSGHMIRSDWLDELGLEVPTTYDELTEVLTAFKTTYDCYSPYLLTKSACPSDGLLAGGYGVIGFTNPNEMDGSAGTSHLFYQDGVVKSSLVMDEYRDFLEMLNEWYDAGLIASDFAALSSNPRDESTYKMIAGGDVGVWSGACENVADFIEMSDDENFAVLPLAEFTLTDDDTETNHFGSSRSLTNSSTSVAISTKCENVIEAVEFLNYFYTEEGIIYANYGVEGYAWEYNDAGEITRTELITNNPDVYEDTAVSVYASIPVPTIGESSYNNTWTDFQIECINLWNSDTDGAWLLPDYLSLTTEETEVISAKLADINTFASEYITKFITGDYDIDTQWDEFQEILVTLGIDEVISIYQDACERYEER